jgi:hypothetical protein
MVSCIDAPRIFFLVLKRGEELTVRLYRVWKLHFVLERGEELTVRLYRVWKLHLVLKSVL